MVAAFQATLEEIAEADLLLHVVDITHPNAIEQARAVEETLEEINAQHIPTVLVLNKADQLKNPEDIKKVKTKFPKSVVISALQGTGMADLLKMIEQELFENFVDTSVQIPYTEGQLISLFHEQGHTKRIEHTRKGVFIQGQLPGRLVARFTPFNRLEPEPDVDTAIEE